MNKILLTGPYKPFSDLEGSSIMDLYDSRLTKGQDIFSLKSYYPSLPLYLIAQNISKPCVVLETPSLEEFVKHVRKKYAYIGISFNSIEFKKVYNMCKIIKEISPETKIVLGGYGVSCLKENFEEEKELLEMVDYVCHGEGVRFMREIIGDDVNKPIKQDFPLAYIYYMGNKISFNNIVSALGCRGACEFCCTSAYYNYKKVRLLSAYDLYKQLKKNVLNNRGEFNWIYDEDFFDDPDYVREFVSYIKEDKDLSMAKVSWGGYGSVRSLSQFTPEELAEMGVTAIWVGIESKYTDLPKRKGKDIKEVFSSLHENGIQTVGSFIIGWDFQTEENIKEDIEHLINLNPTFTQISSLMPCPETKLWEKVTKENRLYKENFKWEKHHLYSSVHRHSSLKDEQILDLIKLTQRKLYEENGPSVLRSFRIHLTGYRKFKNSDNKYLKERSLLHGKWCKLMVIILPAIKKYGPTGKVRSMAESLIEEYKKEFGQFTLKQKIKSSLLISMIGIEKNRENGKIKQPKTRVKVYPNGANL